MKADEIVQLEFQNESLLRQPSGYAGGRSGQHRTVGSNVVLAPAVLTDAFCENCREIANSVTAVTFYALPRSLFTNNLSFDGCVV